MRICCLPGQPCFSGWVNELGVAVASPVLGSAARNPLVVNVVRRQKGGSQSRLVQCDDGKLYVLKMHPNPQGPNVLANEALGSTLLGRLGFPVPRWRPVTINLKSLKAFPDLAMETIDGTTSPAVGVHFGSEFLWSEQHDLYDFLPKSYEDKFRVPEQFVAIYLFDIWANHWDERQCVYRRDRKTGGYEAFFIDNGHLFGGPSWSEGVRRPERTFSLHVHRPMLGDPSIDRCLTVFECCIPSILHQAVAIVPPEWYKNDIYALCARLLERLATLRAILHREIGITINH
jgi:hypothetical protein